MFKYRNTHVFVQRINQFSVVEQHEPPSLPSLKKTRYNYVITILESGFNLFVNVLKLKKKNVLIVKIYIKCTISFKSNFNIRRSMLNGYNNI